MKILATGAAGTVGSYLPNEIIKTDIDAIDGVAHLDVRDRSQVATGLDRYEPDLVLHLAAATDVDKCELDPRAAFLANAFGTRNLALECAARDIALVYTSTAGVFSGDKPTPYHEYDDAHPANVYGLSKLAGERYVQQFVPRSYIVRAGWMIGGGPDGEKKFIAKMLEHAERHGAISAVDDKVGSPTYARHLVQGILELIETRDYGLYHMVNGGACTRYDVARFVNEALGSPFETIPTSSAAFPLPAPRARSEAMVNMLLEMHGRNSMPPWQDALSEYLDTEWSDWRPSPAPAASGDNARTASPLGSRSS